MKIEFHHELWVREFENFGVEFNRLARGNSAPPFSFGLLVRVIRNVGASVKPNVHAFFLAVAIESIRQHDITRYQSAFVRREPNCIPALVAHKQLNTNNVTFECAVALFRTNVAESHVRFERKQPCETCSTDQDKAEKR